MARRGLVLAVVVALVAGAGVYLWVNREDPCPDGTTIYAIDGGADIGAGIFANDIFLLRDGSFVRVTRGGSGRDATLSPDGKRIVFEKTVDSGEADMFGLDELGLFIVNSDGTDLERLTQDDDDSNPAWSPDGSTILFTRGSDLWTVDVETRDEKEIYRVPHVGSDQVISPVWSGDGDQIAFWAGWGRGLRQLYVVDADGSDLEQVPLRTRGADRLAWSPDGTTFAWSRGFRGVPSIYVWERGQERRGRWAIYASYPEFLDDDTIVYLSGKEEGPDSFASHLVTRPVDGSQEPTHVPGTYEQSGPFDVITC